MVSFSRLIVAISFFLVLLPLSSGEERPLNLSLLPDWTERLFPPQPIDHVPVKKVRVKKKGVADHQAVTLLGPIDGVKFCQMYMNDNIAPKLDRDSDNPRADERARENTFGIGDSNDDFGFTLGHESCFEILTQQGVLSVEIAASLYAEYLGTDANGNDRQFVNDVTQIDVVFRTVPDSNQVYIVMGAGLLSQNDLLSYMLGLQEKFHDSFDSIDYISEEGPDKTDGYVQIGVGRSLIIHPEKSDQDHRALLNFHGRAETYLRFSPTRKVLNQVGVRVSGKTYVMDSIYLFADGELGVDGDSELIYSYMAGIGFCKRIHGRDFDIRLGLGQREDFILRDIDHPRDTYIGIRLSLAFIKESVPECSF